MSVLKEPDPRSLDDLYSADPLSLTNDELDNLVADWRSKRALWEREESAAQSEGRRRRPKAYKEAPEKGQLSLSNLGIGKSGSSGKE